MAARRWERLRGLDDDIPLSRGITNLIVDFTTPQIQAALILSDYNVDQAFAMLKSYSPNDPAVVEYFDEKSWYYQTGNNLDDYLTLKLWDKHSDQFEGYYPDDEESNFDLYGHESVQQMPGRTFLEMQIAYDIQET